MTDTFKNLVIDTVVKDGKVISVTMPITGKVINFEYNKDGGVSNVTGDDGEPLDMSTAIGAVAIDFSAYSDSDEADDPLGMGMGGTGVVSIADKIIDMNGKLITLEFTEDGRLEKEVNSKFTSHYFLKETVNYGPLCTNRLAYIYGNMCVMVREVKLEDGSIAQEEVMFGTILTRTVVA